MKNLTKAQLIEELAAIKAANAELKEMLAASLVESIVIVETPVAEKEAVTKTTNEGVGKVSKARYTPEELAAKKEAAMTGKKSAPIHDINGPIMTSVIRVAKIRKGLWESAAQAKMMSYKGVKATTDPEDVRFVITASDGSRYLCNLEGILRAKDKSDKVIFGGMKKPVVKAPVAPAVKPEEVLLKVTDNTAEEPGFDPSLYA